MVLIPGLAPDLEHEAAAAGDPAAGDPASETGVVDHGSSSLPTPKTHVESAATSPQLAADVASAGEPGASVHPSDGGATVRYFAGGYGLAIGVATGVAFAVGLSVVTWSWWTRRASDSPAPQVRVVAKVDIDAALQQANEAADELETRVNDAQTNPSIEGPIDGSTADNASESEATASADATSSTAPRPATATPPAVSPSTSPEGDVAASEASPSASAVVPPEFASPPSEASGRQADSSLLAHLANLLDDGAMREPPPEPQPSNESDSDQTDAESPEPNEDSQSADVESESSSRGDSGFGRSLSRADLAERLRMRLPSAKFNRVPLIDFVRSLRQLSGVPIQIDPEPLLLAGRRPDSPVDFAGEDASLEEVLRQAIAPLGLAPVVEDHVVRIHGQVWDDAELKDVPFPVDDLVTGQDRDLDVVSVVSQLMEPNSWSTAGGQGVIRLAKDEGRLLVRQRRRVLYQVLLMLEKLRVARQLPPRSKFPEPYISMASRWEQNARWLRQPIDANVWHPQPLDEVVRHIEQAAGLRILVDWQALAEFGWYPDSEATSVARKSPLEEVLGRLFSEGEIEIRPLHGGSIQITTAAASARQPYLELYKIEQLGDAGLAQLEDALRTGAGKFVLDSLSDTAIVVLSAAQHRALWRATAPR